MMFRLEAIDIHQEIRQFLYQVNRLETGFEFLNHIVDRGNILISVDLIEDDHRMSLPIEAFDGFSFLPVLRQLELEWVSILAKPLRPILDVEGTFWYQRQLRFYGQKITKLELMISNVNKHCENSEAAYKVKIEVVINCYQPLLRGY